MDPSYGCRSWTNLGGYHQQSISERVGFFQRLAAFIQILNDVDDEAKVDNLGVGSRIIRSVVGVPAGRLVSGRPEALYVITFPAAVIEQHRRWIKQRMTDETLNRSGEIVPRKCSEVPLNNPVT